MKGWIIYSKRQADLTAKDNGVNRLLQAAKERGIELTCYAPGQFELVVSRDDRKVFWSMACQPRYQILLFRAWVQRQPILPLR